MSHYKKLIDALEEYSDFGLTCIPLIGKAPLISNVVEYRDSKPDFETQLKIFEGVKDKITGIGICLGEDHDLSVLDLEADEDLSKHQIPENTPTVESGGGGVHHYFDFPLDLDKDDTRISLKSHGISGDLLLNKSYCTAPPSIHPDTGKEYKWTVPLRHLRPELPDYYVNLYKNHKSLTGKTDWSLVELDEVKEGVRHDTAVRLIGKMLYSFPESDWHELIPPLILGWNEKSCIPSMETSEIMGIYESLVKTHKRNKTGSESSHKSGEEITNKRIHSTLSIQELLLLSDNLKPEFVIDKLIPEKGITYMFGHPGCGKSWLMLEMARAISGGTLFLDTFKTKQQNTMIVDEESGIWEMKRRAELLAINNNLPIFFHCQNGFKFDDDSSVSGLIKLCKEYYITMVIFDPFVAMHSGEENSATEMQKVMDAMQNFTLEGITVLFIHHSRKGGHGNGAQNSRGSSAIHGRADSTLIVEKGTKSGEEFIDVRHTKSRRGKAQEAFRSIVSQPVENGPIELIFDGQTGETVMKRDKARELIMDMLKESSLTRKTIIETISSTSKVGKSNCIAALQELEEGGVISSVLRGREKEYTLPS